MSANTPPLLSGAGGLEWQYGRKISNQALAAVVFLGGFVIIEPAPYELILLPVMMVWVYFGLTMNRHLTPMVGLLFVYCIGGLLALTQVGTFGQTQLLHQAVTIFLAVSAVFFAAIVAADPDRRLRTIIAAYLASAMVVALFGIVTYFELIPGSENFKVASRAASTFQDPNVFGPFLALPAAYLARHILTHRLRESLWAAVGFAIVSCGIFLSFSRAAWGLGVIAILVVAILTFVSERRAVERIRMIGYLLALVIGASALLAMATTLPAVSDLFKERAQLEQTYDGGRLGRFDRQIVGLTEVPEHPLGIGPFEFAAKFGEDEHNMWLKGFTVYGWIGGVSYIALALWTCLAAFPLLLQPRPWLPMLQATYAVLIGHLMIHMVIDADHWRHLFLIYGVLWGVIAVEKSRKAIAPI